MRPFALFLALVTFVIPAVASDPTAARGERIGLVRIDMDEEDVTSLRVATKVRGYLARELRKSGIEAFDARASLDEIARGLGREADYYLLVTGYSSDGYGPDAATGTHGRRVGTGMVVIEIAARLRLYDRSLQLIDDFEVEAYDRTAVPPVVGGRRFGVSFPAPIPGALVERRAAREAARDAAESIVAILEDEARRD